MATGEESSDEEIGGAQLHAEKSGLADYLAEDEMDALRLCREVISHLDWKKPDPEPSYFSEEPVHDPEELLGIIDRDLRQPVDIREVVSRIASYFLKKLKKQLISFNCVTGKILPCCSCIMFQDS